MKRQRIAVGRVGIICKADAHAALATAAEIAEWLTGQGVFVWQSVTTPQQDVLVGMPQLDLLLVLGGDGSIVAVARKTLSEGIPLLGINFGKVGFLAELSIETWQPALADILKKGIIVEKRMGLSFEVLRKGAVAYRGEAINDVVITRGKFARLIRLNLTVDDARFIELRADGLVISTPTGSTGYSSSAGGPLVEPTLDAMIITAICPFLCNFSPLVLEGRSVFEVSFVDTGLDLFLTIDGQETTALELGDVLKVTGVPDRFSFADIGINRYVQRLQRAGFISGSR